jgi:hypothetical protein
LEPLDKIHECACHWLYYFYDFYICDEKESAFKYHQIKQHNGWVQALKLLPYELLYDSSVLRASVIQIKPCFSLQKRTKC